MKTVFIMKQKVDNVSGYKVPDRMNKITAASVLIIGAGLLISGCTGKSIKDKLSSRRADSVIVFILKKDIQYKELSFPAELIPIERAEVYAKVSGYVRNISSDIGDKVQKGTVIAELDSPEVVANFAQVKSEVQNALSKYEGSRDAWRRINSAATVSGTVAAGELERIKSQMMSDSAALEAAKFKLDAYKQIKDYLTIKAPFTGVITQRNVDPGTLVGTGNTKPVFIIERNEILRLRLPVPESYSSEIPEGSSVSFTVGAYPEKAFEARLSRKEGAINLTNRTEIWEFLYQNSDQLLKSGMFANAIIKLRRNEATFNVVSTAIVTNQEKRFVIRLKKGKSQWVDVRNGIVADNRTEIFGNLTEGDTLLLRGTDEIKPGKEFIPVFQSK
jgi:RND family efflux transporter MFP subunit